MVLLGNTRVIPRTFRTVKTLIEMPHNFEVTGNNSRRQFSTTSMFLLLVDLLRRRRFVNVLI